MQQHFHASHKGVALNPSVYAQPWAVWPCGGGTRPGEARIWGADQPRSTCVERTYDWTHMQTHKHTRTYAYTHTSPFPASSSFPVPPVVLVTAIRPGHWHSSWSPPFVHVTAIRPSCVAHTAVCSVAMLPCLLFVDACSTDDPVPALPPWPSAWNCTHDRRVETARLRPQAPRPHLRPCAALRSHLLPFHRQVNQQEGKKR